MARRSLLPAALLLLAVVCHAAHALQLTREEAQGVLKAGLSSVDDSFLAWALQHQKGYATQLQPYLTGLEQTATAVFGPDKPVGAAPVSITTLVAALTQAVTSATPQQQPGHKLRMDRLTAAALLMHQEHPELIQLVSEYSRKREVWRDNLQFAYQHNHDNPTASYWLGVTSLADMSFVEFKGLLGTHVMPATQSSVSSTQQQSGSSAKRPGFMYGDVDISTLPNSMDWRNASAVTHVKNQGMCGSCWAFSTTGTIEGINAIYTHKLLSLSEQELVDCDRDVDQGCNGGMMNNAYEWIVQNRGLALEKDWPYTAAESLEGCSLEAHRTGRRVTIDGFEEVPVGDEAALLKAAAHQPVAVAVEADSRPFQLYVGGVMSDPGCGQQLNHGMLVVGYGGVDHGHLPTPEAVPEPGHEGPYWLVKNSWGPGWGSDGYIKLRMGYRDEATGVQGLCGITLAASYAVKHSPNPPAPKPGPAPTPSPHPAPRPGPVACDDESTCPPGSTCCCLDDEPSMARGGVKGVCGTWGCCPLPDATCCDDKQHCCPTELPVCDTEAGRCKAGPGQGPAGFSIPWILKQSATRRSDAVRQAATTQQEQPTQRRKGIITSTLKRLQVQ